MSSASANSIARQQLDGFIARFSPEIAALVRDVLPRVRGRLRGAVELVYDNYNALAIGFGPSDRTSDAVLSLAVYPRRVLLYFLQGAGLPDPNRLLQGSGNRGRFLPIERAATLAEPAVDRLIQAACARAKTPFDPRRSSSLIIKSVSVKQRPRRPETKPPAARHRRMNAAPRSKPRAAKKVAPRRPAARKRK